MMLRRFGRGALVAALLLPVGVTTAAHADGDHVPVAVDDEVTLWSGSFEVPLDLLANDSDEDGHRSLAICRMPAWDPAVAVEEGEGSSGSVQVTVEPGVEGTYAMEYRACDYSYLVPATLSVTVKPVAQTVVEKFPEHPDQLEVTNPDHHRVWFLWGRLHGDEAAGVVALRPGTSRTIRPGFRRIAWESVFESDDIGVLAGYGRIRGIEPVGGPAGRRALRPAATRIVDRAWRNLAERSTDTAAGPATATAGVDPTTIAPPVTVDEAVTWWAGRMSDLDVLQNDADPDGQPLTICRVGPSSRDLDGFVYEAGLLRVGTDERSSGTFALTYYACNDHRLAPGTLTVHIRRARLVQVTPAPVRPGHFRISNPNGQRVRVELSNYRNTHPDRLVRVPAHSVRYVAPRWRHERWYAHIGPDYGYAGWGMVRLPRR